MFTYITWARIPVLVLVMAGTCAVVPAAVGAPAAPTKAAANQPFTREQLDQMLAPVALYPDALLAQVLMASSYPGDVTDAVAWSKAHPDAKGEDAVRQVASQAWDPSVQSLVAFPQLLAVLGQDPAWVQKMGDAFLAQPDAVMDSVQRLRRQAQSAGHLDSNEQQKVSTQPAAAAAPQTIVIESADPQVVYVPSYNPSVVYGSWAYPAYPPYYYPPPPYYYPGGALLSFGIGVAVGGALWGDLDWGHGDIDIDVNRYNEFNSNRQINRNDSKWKHNAANRDGVPYRDGATRERFDAARGGAGQREAYRGRDDARAAERDRARQSMERRGFDTPATTNREARDRAGASQRELGQRPAGQGRAQAGSGGSQFRNPGTAGHGRPPGSHPDNAFSGTRNPGQSLGDANRGHRSVQSSQRPAAARPQGRPMNRPAAPRGGGGGGRRR